MLNSRIIYLLLFILTAILSACGSSGSSAQQLQSISSWAATVHMAATAWREDRVPETYTKQTLEKAQQELTQKTKAVHLAPQQLQQLQQLNQTVAHIQTAVEHKNKAALQQSLHQLEKMQQQINLMSQQVGES